MAVLVASIHIIRPFRNTRAGELAEELLTFARKQSSTTYIMIGLRGVGCVQFISDISLSRWIISSNPSRCTIPSNTARLLRPSGWITGRSRPRFAASRFGCSQAGPGRGVPAEAISHAEHLKHLPSMAQALLYAHFFASWRATISA